MTITVTARALTVPEQGHRHAASAGHAVAVGSPYIYIVTAAAWPPGRRAVRRGQVYATSPARRDRPGRWLADHDLRGAIGIAYTDTRQLVTVAHAVVDHQPRLDLQEAAARAGLGSVSSLGTFAAVG